MKVKRIERRRRRENGVHVLCVVGVNAIYRREWQCVKAEPLMYHFSLSIRSIGGKGNTH